MNTTKRTAHQPAIAVGDVVVEQLPTQTVEYSVEYGDETGARVTHTFGTDRAAAQQMLEDIAGTEYAGGIGDDALTDATDAYDAERGMQVRAVTATGRDDQRGNWSATFVQTTTPTIRPQDQTRNEAMNASHIARHTSGRRVQTMTDPREASAVQASALGYHLTPAGKHAGYRTFNPREAVGPTAPGIVRRILHAINGGNPSSHAEPDSWDLIAR